MNTDDAYISRCIELASQGVPTAFPNPLVGCVIVCDNKIIGEGYHQKYGESHAEVHAISAVKDKSLLTKSTLYVNLEPCSHYGKTPPCANLIIESGIPNVVIGAIDSYTEVSGNGIQQLQQAGIKVRYGILKSQCRFLNRVFFTFHEKRRPYIILKWAETKDGFIDKSRNENTAPEINWITGNKVKQLVHKWRSEEQAILVGRTTITNDNPQLTVREWPGKNPLRIVIAVNKQISYNSKVLDNHSKTIIFHDEHIHHISIERKSFKNNSENTSYVSLDKNIDFLPQVISQLYNKKIQSVIVEGGAYTLQKFIDANLWDEARVFVGNKNFYEGLRAPCINREYTCKDKIADESLLTYFKD